MIWPIDHVYEKKENTFKYQQTIRIVFYYDKLTVCLYSLYLPGFCIVLAQMSLVVCDNAAKVKLLLDKAADLKSLKCIVVMDTVTEENKSDAKKHGIRLVQFKDVQVTEDSSSGKTARVLCILKSPFLSKSVCTVP